MHQTLYISFKTYQTRLGNYEIAWPAVSHYYRAGALSVSCAACLSECSARKSETDKVCVNDISVWACGACAQTFRLWLQYKEACLQTDTCTEGFVCAIVLVCNTCGYLCGLPSPWQHLCWSGDRLQPAVRSETDRPTFGKLGVSTQAQHNVFNLPCCMFWNDLLESLLDVYIILAVLVKLRIPVLSIMLSENKIEGRLKTRCRWYLHFHSGCVAKLWAGSWVFLSQVPPSSSGHWTYEAPSSPPPTESDNNGPVERKRGVLSGRCLAEYQDQLSPSVNSDIMQRSPGCTQCLSLWHTRVV